MMRRDCNTVSESLSEEDKNIVTGEASDVVTYENHKVVKAQMLGVFEITYNNTSLTSKDISSPMIVKLLAYLLYNHNKTVRFNDLIQFLWEEKDLVNHKGALKNLMYRLRNVLKKHLGEDADFWIADRDGYRWHDNIEVILDVEEWESLIKYKASELTSEMWQQAFELYNGKFMSECEEIYWTMYVQVYYHSRYISLVDAYCYYLSEKRRYTDISVIAKKAITIDTMEETFHYWFIYSLIKQNKLNHANKMYEEALNLLYHGEPESLSNRMKELSNVILWKGLEDVYSLSALIRHELEKNEDAELLKNEESIFPVLKISIKVIPNKEFTLAYEKDVVLEKIEKIIFNTIRMSDILIGHSNMEYTLLLINSSLEGGNIFINRLNDNMAKYGKSLKNIKLKIHKKAIRCRR